LLAVSREKIRFYRGRERELIEVEVEGMPRGMAEIRQRTEYDDQLSFHARDRGDPASGGNHGKFHSLGVSPEDYENVLFDTLLREVAKAVDRHLASSEEPLVLAAEPRTLGHLRKHLTYRHIVQDAIQSDPVGLNKEELHSEAWRIAQPIIRADRENARRRLRAWLEGAAIPGTKDPQMLLRDAIAGRVECIFVAQNANVWGFFDEEFQVLRIDPEPGPGNEDILNRLAIETLIRSGDVFTMPEDLEARLGPVAGLYRY